MSYVRKVISADEKLVLITRLHWIYLLEAVLWFFVFLGIGAGLEYFVWHYAGSKVPNFEIDLYFMKFDENDTPLAWTFGAAGLAVFWVLFMKYISTEIGLTSRRIIQKKGLFMIEVQQVELEDIRGERVTHGWFGWLLGYGRIHFDCRFIDDVYLLAVQNPYRLVKAVHVARMKHTDIPYTKEELSQNIIVIDDQKTRAFKARERLKRLKWKMKKDFHDAEHFKRKAS